ncbi:M48 family metalloprotease [Amantichitinum ursilacus]|uniref:Metalloprotease LoiP n=1 Tax=Amantichitinum ursilacus TaxID=857265 RepID=A0A0N0XIN7_9NEIS|nr:M48 family metalloprotease [Amantichitinum ursilacus]KPC52909.1 Metalloprotease LoiP precursor [Amantichitinum ursilacus]
MKALTRYALLCSTVATLSACAGSGMDTNALLDSGTKVAQAATLTDADMRTLTAQSCQQMDAKSQIAPAGSTYVKRLNNISKGLPTEIAGQPLNFKVYQTKDVNAWAMANGCVRVYSGLMDMMTDDEVRAVLGHEIGHVALGHSRKAAQTAYGVAAARGAVGALGNSTVSALSKSQLADFGEQFVNAQFSQKQESQADDYSFDLLKQKGYNPQALVSSFQKLATLDGGKSSIMSSHPSSTDRAKHIQQRIANGK